EPLEVLQGVSTGAHFPLNAQGGGTRSGALKSWVPGGSALAAGARRATSAWSPPPPERSSPPISADRVLASARPPPPAVALSLRKCARQQSSRPVRAWALGRGVRPGC